MNNHKRIFQSIPLALNQTVWLDDRACHYLLKVLRIQTSETLTLFNGEGGEYRALITEIHKQKIAVFINEYLPDDRESPISICLAQGIARGEKMDMIIQKAIELGVTHIVPLMTERSQIKLDKKREEKKQAHWQGIIISACEQSGRNRLPLLSAPISLKEWLDQPLAAQAKWVLSPHAVSAFNTAKWDQHCRSFACLIGPEGGFSEEEVRLAGEKGFLAYRLGPRILRTETAPLAALTILQYQYGDFTNY